MLDLLMTCGGVGLIGAIVGEVFTDRFQPTNSGTLSDRPPSAKRGADSSERFRCHARRFARDVTNARIDLVHFPIIY